jgi:hypothetical protein
MRIAEIFYRLATALWVGGVGIFTFMLTPILFRNEPRDVAARIVGLLFPGYFRWGLGCGVVALAALFLARRGALLPQAIIIAAMLAIASFQAFYIEPKAAALKREIGSFEATPKDHPLRRDFSRLHGISAAGNLAVFAGGVILVILP